MPYTIKAECPCCNKTATSIDEIESKFGFRIIENGKKIPQSYCRSCRIAHCEAGQPCKVQ